MLSENLPAGQGLHVAIGTSGHGVAGFARSHREALAVRRIGTGASKPARSRCTTRCRSHVS
ncbi:hypothetical protein [Rhodococcus sp. NPDC058521]|uniref:hypothetical protein n=1 Tax=Rhodococcus sp. NPDC058521 TaxID=3346536 RepID=UPI0036674080